MKPDTAPNPAVLAWATQRLQATIARCLKAVESTYRMEADERLRLADALRREGRQ